MEIRNSFRSEQSCFKSLYPGFWISQHPIGRANGKVSGALPAGWSAQLGRLRSVGSTWERERAKTKRGRRVWEEGIETSQETWARIPRGEHCFSPVVEWGRRERAGRPKSEGGKRRGEEGENKRICASTLPSSLSCLLSSSWSSSHLCSREILTHSLLRRKTQLSCAPVHKFWVVKIVLSLRALRGFPAGSEGRASVCNGGRPRFDP